MIEEFWIDDGALLLTHYTGDVTGVDLINDSLKKSGDMRFDNVKYLLSDWTKIINVRVTPQDVKQLVACLRPISRICPNAKTASIVKPNPSGNALIAWYKFLADDLTWDVAILSSIEEAKNWCPLYRKYLSDRI